MARGFILHLRSPAGKVISSVSDRQNRIFQKRFFLNQQQKLIWLKSDDKCVTAIGELGTTLAVASNRRTLRRNTFIVTLMMKAVHSIETSFLTRGTWPKIPEDGILLS
jgi:hypothetical protein